MRPGGSIRIVEDKAVRFVFGNPGVEQASGGRAMRKLVVAAVALAIVLGALLPITVGAGAPDPKPQADFKLLISLYGTGKEPVSRAELLTHNGRSYQFLALELPQEEVIVHDPGSARMELIDIRRRVRSEVAFKQLDAYQAKLHNAVAAACAKREKEGGKANLVAAAMSRDLIDPRFSVAFDPALNRLRLTNPTVEIEAAGVPDLNRERLAVLEEALLSLIRLGALREPQAIPPFPRLEAVKTLISGHHLLPSEISSLYRLTGRPLKIRWTYEFVPTLTPRELKALSMINALRDRCRFVRFDAYQHDLAPEPPAKPPR
jgi:hypothetical protein